MQSSSEEAETFREGVDFQKNRIGCACVRGTLYSRCVLGGALFYCSDIQAKFGARGSTRGQLGPWLALHYLDPNRSIRSGAKGSLPVGSII